MLILVTRPEPQATEWAAELQALNAPAAALPLIDIAAPHDPSAVERAWHQLPNTRLVMFVSPNAVAWFARLRPEGLQWPAKTLAAAPGPGTAQALRAWLTDTGLSEAQLLSPPADSAQFDSEHLWPVLAPLDWQAQQILVISGGDQSDARGRAWLSQQLIGAGAHVQAVLTYQRQQARWDPAQHTLARQAYAAPAQHTWLLSSSEAVDHLLALMGPPPPGAQALATHPRVSDKALEAGFTEVSVVAPRPEAVAQARRSTTAPET
jgi:uroporphyrinogen-III synthase